MDILWNLHIIHREVACNAVNGGGYISPIQRNGGFGNDVAYTVTNQDFYRNAGIFGFLVCQIHQGTGDSVRHLIRVARIYFFKHNQFPFLARSRRSMTSS